MRMIWACESVIKKRRAAGYDTIAAEPVFAMPARAKSASETPDRAPLSELTALSPADGRYAGKTQILRGIFSEFGLMRRRVAVEVRWFKALAACAQIPQLPALSDEQNIFLDNIAANFSPADARAIKKIESQTRHDVKAVEYFLKERLDAGPGLAPAREFVHFACTSEDINNLACALMLRDGLAQVLLPALDRLSAQLERHAGHWAELPMLARTHGQAASPTTVGKEFRVFAARCKNLARQITGVQLGGKINGATGNYNAHIIACPAVDWRALSAELVASLGLAHHDCTTQVAPNDDIAALLHAMCRFNSALLDMNRDLWGYIALGYFGQRAGKNEVGSSTMPHKINPIDFENSEGNIGIANALAQHLAAQLPLSRWQRDLSNSTVIRNLGLVFAHTLLAAAAAANGLGKLTVDRKALARDLEHNPQVLAEAVQTVMRLHGIRDSYEQLKELTRGKSELTLEELRGFVRGLKIPGRDKQRLLQLAPHSYTGMAADIARRP